ncbi:hypothetical protein NPIL_582211 [Nephila pilipes]|uniref:Uncharacterized protein n=1 Tax=Nephila pilipes TaxID=299642 RepID=A0A8X6N908_NEPPI|nr:hypothetical protein NPIL_582211 [Nephila pilipes]
MTHLRSNGPIKKGICNANIQPKLWGKPYFYSLKPTTLLCTYILLERAKNMLQRNDLRVMNSWVFCPGRRVSRIDWDKTTLSTASLRILCSSRKQKRLAVEKERCPLFSCQRCFVSEYYPVPNQTE